MGGRNVETVQMLTGDAGGEHRTLFHHAALCIIGEVLSINAKQMQSRCKTDAKQMQNRCKADAKWCGKPALPDWASTVWWPLLTSEQDCGDLLARFGEKSATCTCERLACRSLG
jgi:hypothetical protein